MVYQLTGRCYFPMKLGPVVEVERRGIHIGLLAQLFDDQWGLRSESLVRRSLRCAVCRCIVFLRIAFCGLDRSFSYAVNWGSFFGSKKCCWLFSLCPWPSVPLQSLWSFPNRSSTNICYCRIVFLDLFHIPPFFTGEEIISVERDVAGQMNVISVFCWCLVMF